MAGEVTLTGPFIFTVTHEVIEQTVSTLSSGVIEEIEFVSGEIQLVYDLIAPAFMPTQNSPSFARF